MRMMRTFFYANKSLITLEKEINKYLVNINYWLCANKLLLNVMSLTSVCLVYPHFLYGIIIWGNTYSTTTIIPFERNSFSYYNLFWTPRSHQPSIYKIEIHLLKFNDLVYLHTTMLLFDFHVGNVPEYFADFFTFVNKICHYNTRRSSCSVVIHCLGCLQSNCNYKFVYLV
jgi:hypothetical protein